MENKFDINDCLCESATVYLDRAEVARSAKVSVKKGDNEIIFNNLSDFLDEDSVRVEGKGPATISEVSFQSRLMTPQEEEEKQSVTDEVHKQLMQLTEQENTLVIHTTRLKKQREVLEGFANSVMKPSATSAKEHKGENSTLLNSDVLKGMSEFFDLFDSKAANLDEAIQDTEQKTKKLRQEIGAMEQKLNKSRYDNRHKEDKHLSVLLEAHEDAEVTLLVRYLVSNASWSPKYDLRIYSNEKKIKIMYHGGIKQGTGEDWNDVNISLSSAMPSVAGTVPKLGTQKVCFPPKAPQPVFSSFEMGRPVMEAKAFRSAPQVCAAPPPPPMMMASMTLPQATVTEGISSAVFEVVRKANIPSDKTEHKVTVAVIDLQPQFHYECVPKKSTFAYLKAKVTNNSPYPLLAGPTNIFLDNNFIAKGTMKAVSPGEEFECSCGIDPSIKISYKPVEKHRSQTGWVNKAKLTTFRQVIELKNTHQEPAQLRVTEHFPQSTESSIKVVLQEPALPHKGEKAEANAPVHMTKQHNIEWNMELAAGASKDLVLKYTIELPTAEELEYREEFASEV